MKLNKDQELVCGINATNEIISIRPDSVSKLFIEEDKGRRIEKLSKLAKEKKIEVIFQDTSFFQKNFTWGNEQQSIEFDRQVTSLQMPNFSIAGGTWMMRRLLQTR